MAAGSTYTPIATTTLGSATNSVEFTSISGSYTDLVFVANFSNTSNTDLYFRVNGSTSGYSVTQFYGASWTSTKSSRYTNTNTWVLDPGGNGMGTGQTNLVLNIQDYSNTTTYKTSLARVNSEIVAGAVTGLWRDTSAITSVRFYVDQNFASGSTFTIYGITAA
jgi:hypothetical protein